MDRADRAGRRTGFHRDDLLARDDLQSVERLGHGPDVIGHSPATSADQPHALVAQPQRARREVLGRRLVDETAVHVDGGTGVRKG